MPVMACCMQIDETVDMSEERTEEPAEGAEVRDGSWHTAGSDTWRHTARVCHQGSIEATVGISAQHRAYLEPDVALSCASTGCFQHSMRYKHRRHLGMFTIHGAGG